MNRTHEDWLRYIRDRAKQEGYKLWLGDREILRWCEENANPDSDEQCVWQVLLGDTPWAHKEGEFEHERSS